MEGPQDEIYTSFAQTGGEGTVICQGPPGARFLLKFTSKRLYVLADGEPRGKHLTSAFQEAVAAGLPRGIRTLADVTRFTGSVDWEAVRGLRDLAPCFGDRETHVAYVVRDDLFGRLIKIAAAIFPKIQHRVFHDRAAAEAWLDTV